MKSERLVILLSVVLLVGCLTSAGVVPGEASYPPRPPDWEVLVFIAEGMPVDLLDAAADVRQESEVPPGAVEIGRADVRGGGFTPETAVVARAQKEARKLGGDGVLMTHATGLPGLDSPAITFTFLRWKP